ncbi:MAG: hypothetical protein P8Z38_10425 [Robiginitalea sp.]
MKIRIEDNSVRMRLRKSEVSKLSEEGRLCAATVFPEQQFEYCLEADPGTKDLIASFSGGRITVRMPESWIHDWPDSPKVGFETSLEIGTASLHILIEKDFVCLDRDPETQKDQFANPKQGKI